MIEVILALGFILTVGYAVMVAQIVALARLLRSQAWILIAAGFVSAGVRMVWGFIQRPSAMIRAVANGNMPEQLTAEQWIVFASTFLTIGLLIAGFDRLRRDFDKLKEYDRRYQALGKVPAQSVESRG